jgi:hypothetical protein
MLIISNYLLGTKSIETISTREVHEILYVRIENELSDPEIYILEDINTPQITKQLLIVQENVQLDLSINELKFINAFEFRKGLHKFFVFDLPNKKVINKNIISQNNNYVKAESSVNTIQPEIDVFKKFVRVPKPDLDKIYTKDELLKMHPLKQLRYILINKYNLKNRICNKLSIDNQIDFILVSQEGQVVNPLSYLNTYKDFEEVCNNINETSKESIRVLSRSNYDPQLKIF